MLLKRYRNAREYNKENRIKPFDVVAPEWQTARGLGKGHIIHFGKFVCGTNVIFAEPHEMPSDMHEWLMKLPTDKNYPDLCQRCHVGYKRTQQSLHLTRGSLPKSQAVSNADTSSELEGLS